MSNQKYGVLLIFHNDLHFQRMGVVSFLRLQVIRPRGYLCKLACLLGSTLIYVGIRDGSGLGPTLLLGNQFAEESGEKAA